MSVAGGGRRVYFIACALALAAVIAAYANHFRNEFHFDDDHTIQNNTYIRDLRNIPLFFKSARTFSRTPSHQSYRPLVTTTLAIDYRIAGGLNPLVFHATSFGLFAAQCIAMLFLLRRILDRAQPHRWNRWLALFAVSWYGLHAANAETVNYIIARSEILSTLGTVLALLLFSSGGRARRWGLYLVPAAAAVLAKEQGAMAASLLFVYVALFEYELSLDQLLRPRHFAAVLRVVWPAVAVCGGLVAISIRLANTWVPGGTSRMSYLLTQPFVLMHYALAFLLPLNLSADTDWKPMTNPFDDRVLLGLIFVVCALWAAQATSRRRETRPVAFGILWFFLALLPTSSIIPLAEVMNDHRMYFPFVGLVIAATSLLGIMLKRRETAGGMKRWMKPATVVACMAILTGHAYSTHQRNRVWHTDESLWLDVTQKSPENGRGLMNYGLIQMQQGKWTSAEQYFRRALHYSPNYSCLHINIGILKAAMGKTLEADQHFKLAQEYDPTEPMSYFYYARWLRSVQRGDEALAMARRAVELGPADVQARHLMLEILAEREDWAAVKSVAQDTLNVESRDQAAASWLARAQNAQTAGTRDGRGIAAKHWLELSLVQLRNEDYEDAVESSRRALELRPEDAVAYNNICAAENALGSYAAAAAACEQALLRQPDSTLARHNLAFALSQTKPSFE